LGLSLGLGTAVACFLRQEGRWALAAMGAPAGSLLSMTGLPYLRARALAAPAVLMFMVCEGVYRGFGDTMTPLPIAMTVAFINLFLDPLLIFARESGGT
jgi:Na+-driven multidrug efflux pump